MNEMQEIPPLFRVGGKRVLGGFLTFVCFNVLLCVVLRKTREPTNAKTQAILNTKTFFFSFSCFVSLSVCHCDGGFLSYSRLIIITSESYTSGIQILIKIKCINPRLVSNSIARRLGIKMRAPMMDFFFFYVD